MKQNKLYKPGTRISLKHLNNNNDKDEYDLLVEISNFIYKHVLPFIAIVFMIDYALRVNGL